MGRDKYARRGGCLEWGKRGAGGAKGKGELEKEVDWEREGETSAVISYRCENVLGEQQGKSKETVR